MGEAELDIKPLVECAEMDLTDMPDGSVLKKVPPSRSNCLAEESCCTLKDGKVIQQMYIRLRKVECGELLVEAEWDCYSGPSLLECILDEEGWVWRITCVEAKWNVIAVHPFFNVYRFLGEIDCFSRGKKILVVGCIWPIIFLRLLLSDSRIYVWKEVDNYDFFFIAQSERENHRGCSSSGMRLRYCWL